MTPLYALVNEQTHLKIVQGETINIEARIRHEGTTLVYQLSGGTVVLKMAKTDGTTLAINGTVTAGGSGICTFVVSASDSESLKVGDALNFEIVCTVGGVRRVVQAVGKLCVKPKLFAI